MVQRSKCTESDSTRPYQAFVSAWDGSPNDMVQARSKPCPHAGPGSCRTVRASELHNPLANLKWEGRNKMKLMGPWEKLRFQFFFFSLS